MGKHINIHVGGLWRCKGTGGAGGACTIARETRIQCKLCRWIEKLPPHPTTTINS